MEERGLSKHHNITVRSHPGATATITAKSLGTLTLLFHS